MSISSGEPCANHEGVEAQSPTLPKATLGHNIRRARNPVSVATIRNRNLKTILVVFWTMMMNLDGQVRGLVRIITSRGHCAKRHAVESQSPTCRRPRWITTFVALANLSGSLGKKPRRGGTSCPDPMACAMGLQISRRSAAFSRRNPDISVAASVPRISEDASSIRFRRGSLCARSMLGLAKW
jgi:hypothetical protein